MHKSYGGKPLEEKTYMDDVGHELSALRADLERLAVEFGGLKEDVRELNQIFGHRAASLEEDRTVIRCFGRMQDTMDSVRSQGIIQPARNFHKRPRWAG